MTTPMANKARYIKLFESLHFKDPHKVYDAFMDNHITKIIIYQKNLHIYQSGGAGKYISSDTRLITYDFEGKKFKIYEVEEPGGRYELSVHRNDDLSNPEYCLYIKISPDDRTAVLQNVSYYSNCVSTGLEHPGGGGVLLRLAIEYLTKFKTDYQIDRIVLQDNSFFKCNKMKENIFLPILHTLLYGNTWYGKYGFKPYDQQNKKVDERMYEKYKNNYRIVTKTKIKDTRLYESLFDVYKKTMSEEDANKKAKFFIDRYGERTIDSFTRKFLKKYDKVCEFFSKFYLDFYDNSGLVDFTTKVFFLEI